MARKNTEHRTQNTERNKNETLSTESIGTFPQITSKCSIKQVILKKKGQDIRFEGFKISEGQAELLSGLVATGEEINLTISAVQGRLPGMT
ncbi:MAG: hypothetical protein ABSG99_02840 [Sedimentisphaerales bacterium]